MRTKCQSIAIFHRPIHSHWSLPLNGRCNVNQIVILQILSATPIQDMNTSAPILLALWRADGLALLAKIRSAFSARHPMEVPPTEPTAMKIWRWASANVYEWRMYDCMNVSIVLYKEKKNAKKVAYGHQTLKKKIRSASPICITVSFRTPLFFRYHLPLMKSGQHSTFLRQTRSLHCPGSPTEGSRGTKFIFWILHPRTWSGSSQEASG
jgi:hypothetical protein